MGVDIVSLLSLQGRARRNARSQLLVLRRRRREAAEAARFLTPPPLMNGAQDGERRVTSG